MISKKKILILGLTALITTNFTAVNKLSAQTKENKAVNTKIEAPKPNTNSTEINTADAKSINPIELVANPNTFLNNKIKFAATFDKFTTLGLDYKPAFRDSKEFISFLIKRPDVTDHTIPLSELKLIMPREKAEKLIDLESGDQIELTGQVFSTALNDPWVDVNDIKILSSKNKIDSANKKTELKSNKN